MFVIELGNLICHQFTGLDVVREQPLAEQAGTAGQLTASYPSVSHPHLLSPPTSDPTACSDCSDDETFFETEEDPPDPPQLAAGPLVRSESARQLLRSAEAKRALVQSYLSAQPRLSQSALATPIIGSQSGPGIVPVSAASSQLVVECVSVISPEPAVSPKLDRLGTGSSSCISKEENREDEAAVASDRSCQLDQPLPVSTNPFLTDEPFAESLTAESRPKLVKKAKAPPPPPVLTNAIGLTDINQAFERSTDVELELAQAPESPQLLYQSPGYPEEPLRSAPAYPLLSASPATASSPPLSPELRLRRSLSALTAQTEPKAEDLPIREQPLPFPHPSPAPPTTATTKILTISREGITRLRSYPVEKEDEGEQGAYWHGLVFVLEK